MCLSLFQLALCCAVDAETNAELAILSQTVAPLLPLMDVGRRTEYQRALFDAIDSNFSISFTYHSNRIEGAAITSRALCRLADTMLCRQFAERTGNGGRALEQRQIRSRWRKS